MKKLEGLLGIVAGIFFSLTALIALMAIATLIYKGPARHATAVAQSAAPADAAPATQPETAAAPAPTAEVKTAGVSVAAGEKLFKKCKACHTVDEGGKNTTGPNLWDILDRGIAAHEGFAYSDGMSAKAGGSWDVALLDQYLTKPKDVVPGTKMAFAGLPKEEDRQNVIVYLASLSANPKSAEALGFAAASGTEVAAAAESPAADGPVEIEPVPYPDGVTYTNPPAPTDAEIAASAAAVEEIQKELATMDYQRAQYDPIHFAPAINTATNEECLTCHQEIMDHKPRETSQAGVAATDTIAWYQTLDTYTQDQASFHWRHMESDFAKEAMNLQCVFCHKGNDPREESPDMLPTRAAFSAPAQPEFTLRKMVNPSTTCLRCHGAMPDPENIMGLAGSWPEARVDLESPEAPNGCLSCHAELFRTERHNVSYLKAANIEELARAGSSDSCYGCHGGRQWYRISYPYPRHAWPGMDDSTVPDWAVNRPTESDPEYALPAAAQ